LVAEQEAAFNLTAIASRHVALYGAKNPQDEEKVREEKIKALFYLQTATFNLQLARQRMANANGKLIK
jgi:hypothetical protein